MILLDTSGLLALIDSAQSRHADTAAAIATFEPPFLLSPFVLAELDYLLATRVGLAAEQAFLGEVAAGAYRLVHFDAHDVGRARKVIEKYADLEIGLADASIVVLAERHRVHDVLTLDERHFRVLMAAGESFRLIPADL
ncbi:MAG: VapC toxin family PIN domain ribonuclease [Acidobacteriota bacterium]